MAQSFYPTAQQITDDALLELRAYDAEQTPTTTQRTNALRTLNYMVTSWQADGMQVWCQKQATYTLVAGTNTFTIGPAGSVNIQRPLSVQIAWLRDTNGRDIPLRMIGREEYLTISDKTATGTPNCVFYDPTYDLPGGNTGANAKGTANIWPTPDASVAALYTLYFVYTRPIQDFAAGSDTLDFPQSWFNAVKWNLIYQLCPGYTIPLEEQDRLKNRAEKEKDLVSGSDVEMGSVYIQPSRAWGRR